MAATIRDHDLQLLSGEPGSEPETDDHGYTIRAQAPDDVQEQMRIANGHLGRARDIRAQAARKVVFLRAQAAELEQRAAALEARAESDAQWQERPVLYWAQDPWVRRQLGASIELAAGRAHEKAVRQTTVVVDEAVRAYADAQGGDVFAALMVPAYKVNRTAVRKRFKLTGGDVLDLETGEVLGPVTYLSDDGHELTAPLIVETRPASREVVIDYYAEMQTEDDTDGGCDSADDGADGHSAGE